LCCESLYKDFNCWIFPGNYCGDEGCRGIIGAIRFHPTLRELSLACRSIGSGVEYHNPCIEFCTIGDVDILLFVVNGFGSKALKALAEVIASTTLCVLDLSGIVLHTSVNVSMIHREKK
jgi:hypothetical protein